jgi:hypothetical protein
MHLILISFMPGISLDQFNFRSTLQCSGECDFCCFIIAVLIDQFSPCRKPQIRFLPERPEKMKQSVPVYQLDSTIKNYTDRCVPNIGLVQARPRQDAVITRPIRRTTACAGMIIDAGEGTQGKR